MLWVFATLADSAVLSYELFVRRLTTAEKDAYYEETLHATQVLGTVFDGAARHTAEGYAFQRRAAEAGFKAAVRERDEPFDS